MLNFKRRSALFLVGLLLAVLMVACGDSANTQVSTTATATTAAATTTSSFALPSLTETVSASDGLTGTITVKYPSGWGKPITGGGGLFLFTTDAASQNFLLRTLKSGELYIQIAATNNRPTIAETMDFSAKPYSTELGVTLSTPEAYKLGGVDGLRASGVGTKVGLLAVVVPGAKRSVIFFGSTSKEEYSKYEPLLKAIAESITYKE
ncbi:hypothetical protein [Candidatus Chlorohelix sp.]|uniref:hypothetical protein n=1 Tax=Candidatus Chlorohelix sp. TaxID=3139201 RepID=UPI003025CAB1